MVDICSMDTKFMKCILVVWYIFGYIFIRSVSLKINIQCPGHTHKFWLQSFCWACSLFLKLNVLVFGCNIDSENYSIRSTVLMVLDTKGICNIAFLSTWSTNPWENIILIFFLLSCFLGDFPLRIFYEVPSLLKAGSFPWLEVTLFCGRCFPGSDLFFHLQIGG